jgi:hypothetical protein
MLIKIYFGYHGNAEEHHRDSYLTQRRHRLQLLVPALQVARPREGL